MMNSVKPALYIAIVLSLLAGSAQAQMGWGRNRVDVPVLAKYDADKDGVLDAAERRVAMKDFGYDPGDATPVPLSALHPKYRDYTTESLYEPLVLRTLYIDFDTADWDRELVAFKSTDVKVPATLRMDGKTYRDVGVAYHGLSSYQRTASGFKRSLSLDIDLKDHKQRLLGNRNLLLLNSAGDATFMRGYLHMQVAREWLPAAQVNFVRVILNGSYAGIYVNQQPVDTVWAKAAGGATGPIWKVPGSPNGRGGLEYWGEDSASYQSTFKLKNKGAATTKDDAWSSLIRLCRVLNQTPIEDLQAALAPILDVENALRFLAVDNAMMNEDGYWTRASDYNLYMDAEGRYKLAPHDVNESMESGGFRSGSGDGATLDPLVSANDGSKPLLSRLLAVPALRARYLAIMRGIAEQSLDWNKIEPAAMKVRALIAADIAADPTKHSSTEAFSTGFSAAAATAELGASTGAALSAGRGFRGSSSFVLEEFIKQRRAFLLVNFPAGGGAARKVAAP